MEEITFEDILAHYELKLKETSDGLQNARANIKKAHSMIDSSWTGQSANVCSLKLQEISADILKSENEISEAMTKLSAIGQLLAEGNITTF